MTDPVKPATESDPAAKFRKTLVRVMTVQVISLVLLWLLQQRYAG